MNSLEEWLSERREKTIEALASYIEQSIQEQWQLVFQQSQEELVHLYDKVGEAAYGRYAGRLFRPIREQLTQAGFVSSPVSSMITPSFVFLPSLAFLQSKRQTLMPLFEQSRVLLGRRQAKKSDNGGGD